MALVKCEECGKKHSESAEACPNCGHPNPINVTKKEISIIHNIHTFFFIPWLFLSIYIILKNWSILSICNTDKFKTSELEFFFSNAFISLYLPIIQFFGMSNVFPHSCGQLFDSGHLIFIRFTFVIGIICLLLGWLGRNAEKMSSKS